MAITGSALPGADVYGWRRNDAETAYQNALVALGRRRQGVLQQYGYTADFDPTGHASNVRIDPNAQYGQVQTMLRGQAQGYEQLDDSLRERGLGETGLAAQFRGEARYQAGGQLGALGSGLQGDLTQAEQDQLQAGQTRTSTLAGIDADAARQAIEDQAFMQANYPDFEMSGDYSNADDGDVPDGTDSGTNTPNPPPPKGTQAVKGKTVLWGGSYLNAKQLAAKLRSQGVKPSTWAANHPAAAKAIGPLPKPAAKAAPKPAPKPAPRVTARSTEKAPPKPKKKGK